MPPHSKFGPTGGVGLLSLSADLDNDASAKAQQPKLHNYILQFKTTLTNVPYIGYLQVVAFRVVRTCCNV